MYTTLRHSYEQRKHRRISRLKQLYRMLGDPSTGHLSLSSLSSESTLSSLSDTTDSEDEETTSEDSWAAALALVVGFRAREGGFFEAGLVLGGGILIQWIDSRLRNRSDLKVACYWKRNYRTDYKDGI